MAVTAANLTSAISDTDASSYASSSITPGSNRLILATFVSRTASSTDPNAPTATGNGLTWVQVATVVFDTTSSTRRRVTLLRAMGSPSTGAVAFDLAGQTQTSATWSIDEFDGVDTGGTNGSAAIVQSATNFDGSATVNTLTVTLGAFGSTDNATFGGFGFSGVGGAATVGSGFTQLAERNNSGIGENGVGLLTEWKSTNDTSVDASTPTNTELGGIAIEIKAAVVAATSTFGTRSLLGVGY